MPATKGKFTRELIDWSLRNNAKMKFGRSDGPVPCPTCEKEMYEDDDVIIATNRKGHTRGIFCSKTCQRQYMLDYMVRRNRT